MHSLLLAAVLWSQPGAIAFGDYTVSGRVTDGQNKPMRSVRVELWEKQGPLYFVTKTNRRGEFEFIHEPCSSCFLEVTAPPKSRLAQALIENVPGKESRSYVVSLKHGFLIEGKIASGGKGLKGLVVKVFSQKHSTDTTARTHGGGAVRTNRSGSFKIVLTPGEKKILVLNKRYPSLANRFEAKLKVTGDMKLAPIELPSK